MKAREWLARGAYSGLLAVMTPAYLLKLWWRGRAEPMYRHAIGERLGDYHGAAWQGGAGSVWVHAVSLGETKAAAPLIAALRDDHPRLRLLLTHSTATGRAAGQPLLRPGDLQTWLPYDTPSVVERFFAQFKPAVGVLMETEVWPNLLHAAKAAGVPMVLANARLSEKSLRQGQRLDAVLRPAAQSLSLVLAQTEADSQRLCEAGAAKVIVCGNLKYDISPDAVLIERGRAWRSALQRSVVMGAITREGEEAMLLDAWTKQPAVNRPLLLIVPRHPQRFDEVAALVAAKGLTLARRSAWGESPDAQANAADVWLGDSIGEMPLYYGAADVALLGGSFAPLGGHNLIEAAACGCPLVMGPHTFNFADAATLSLAAGASTRVADMDEGVALALQLSGSEERDRQASAALAFAAAHRGAAQRMAAHIAPLLSLPR
jgi:3-deoxy-D-manno-octulosonic-acid transferase